MIWQRIKRDGYVKTHWVGFRQRGGSDVCYIRRWPHSKTYVLCWNDARYPERFATLIEAKHRAEVSS